MLACNRVIPAVAPVQAEELYEFKSKYQRELVPLSGRGYPFRHEHGHGLRSRKRAADEGDVRAMVRLRAHSRLRYEPGKSAEQPLTGQATALGEPLSWQNPGGASASEVRCPTGGMGPTSISQALCLHLVCHRAVHVRRISPVMCQWASPAQHLRYCFGRILLLLGDCRLHQAAASLLASALSICSLRMVGMCACCY